MNPVAGSDRATIPGSERSALVGARAVGEVDPAEQITVTMVLRRGNEKPDLTSPDSRVERESFTGRYGADAGDLEKVERFAAGSGLRVTKTDPAARTVTVTGSADALSQAFGVELKQYGRGESRYRGREGAITVPKELDGIVVGVLGLDDRAQARPHIHRRRKGSDGAGGNTSYTPVQVGEMYGFPAEASGAGECIGLIELGGGYEKEDLELFFGGLDMSVPDVVAVGVEGAGNDFAGGGGANGEVALDIQVAGAMAPAARIAVYFAANTDQGFLGAINEAVHDATNKPSVISISWGGPEESWTPQAMEAMDEALADAAALGVSVFVASGDQGSADRLQLIENEQGQLVRNPEYDGKAHVNFPASAPHAIACGGTRLEGEGTVIDSETVWNDGNGWASGGGVSAFFKPPAWQQEALAEVEAVTPPGKRPGRGVPDIAGDADAETGYQIYCAGRAEVAGGTSAVAPLWAGITARLNREKQRQLGFLNTALYSSTGRNCLRDVTSGTNAIAAAQGVEGTPGYEAKVGWDGCTGLGTPNGAALRAL
jgi:kumamolisin